ncbi:flagellar biosynthetic protein FliO [Candidatus Haliotispira prima]|uniref:Flagellar biosynthetic protein FliO n=1 Tax=Candidatus Haliotispira prima TaxID=3034016 RepID=A0ABY8MG71_9SPIO|nr:flagellar biosynthetic protein FliO [Candidatus Haliotispira prima]
MSWTQTIRILLLPALVWFCLAVSIQVQEPRETNDRGWLDENAIPVELGRNSATEANQPQPGNQTEESNLVSASLYLRVFLILSFLIVLIYFTLKFLRRLSLQRPKLPDQGEGIQILSSQILHGDHMLHIVEVGGECYLLGSGAGGVQLLDHYTDPELKDRVILEATVQTKAQGSLVRRGNAVPDFLQLVRNRLNRGGLDRFGGARAVTRTKTREHSEQGSTEPTGSAPSLRTDEYRERVRSAAEALRPDQEEKR